VECHVHILLAHLSLDCLSGQEATRFASIAFCSKDYSSLLSLCCNCLSLLNLNIMLLLELSRMENINRVSCLLITTGNNGFHSATPGRSGGRKDCKELFPLYLHCRKGRGGGTRLAAAFGGHFTPVERSGVAKVQEKFRAS